MSSGETDLGAMLRGLKPSLDPRRFSFETDPHLTMRDGAERDPWGLFREAEGLTLIVEGGAGPHFSMITLGIHSSLEAVGLTAAVSGALGEAGISANMIAAYFHDHVFVAEGDAAAAMAVLEGLASA